MDFLLNAGCFLLGLVLGAFVVSKIWAYAIAHAALTGESIEADVLENAKKFVATRPDNEKARRFADPRYKAMKEEKILKKAPGGS